MSLLSHEAHEDRPWGSFDRFTANEPSTVKLIHVNPGARFSLQTHQHRSEFWQVLTGSGTARIGSEDREARAGVRFEIPAGTPHRLTAGPEGLWFLEISLGDFDEADITRLEDDYGRVT